MSTKTALPDPLPSADAPTVRLAWRLAEVAKAIGLSRRTLEREIASGRFPAPDVRVRRTSLWKPSTVQAWLDRAGKSSTKKVR